MLAGLGLSLNHVGVETKATVSSPITYSNTEKIMGSTIISSAGSYTSTVSEYSVSFAGIKTGSSSTSRYSYIMFTNGAGYCYNTTAPVGFYISNVSVVLTSGSAKAGKILTTFGSSTLSTLVTATRAITQGETYSVDNTNNSCQYFNFSTSTSNVQVASIVVTLSASKSLTSIAVSGTPSTTSYYEGASFDPTGLTVSATYSSGDPVDVSFETVWTPNPLTAGTTEVTGTYTFSGVSKTCTVSGLTVNARTISSIAVTTQPTKTAYYVGDVLDYTGVVITATWNVGDDTDVTDLCAFDPTEGTTVLESDINKITVSASYSSKSASFDLDVSLLTIETLQNNRTSLNGKSVFFYGTVTSIISNGTSYNIYVQDGDYATMAYLVPSIPENVAVGAKVSISGTVSIYSGLLEIVSPTVTYIGVGTLPTAYTIAEANYSSTDLALMDSRLVTMTVKYVSGTLYSGNAAQSATLICGKTNVTLRSASAGAAASCYLAYNTFFSKVGTYGTFTFTGILGWYNGPQLSPSDISEVSSADVTAVDALYEKMHMTETANNQCLTYYPIAKSAYDGLSTDQKAMFDNATYYADAKLRLDAWKVAYDAANPSVGLGIIGNNVDYSLVAIISISSLFVLAIGGYFFYKKKRSVNK